MSVTRYAIIAFIISTIKTIPFSYLLQFYYRVVINLVLPRFKYLANGKKNTFGITGESPLDLFSYTTFNSYVSPMEIDMYLHKSNSTYFQDLDIARTNLVTKVFQKSFYKYFDNENNDFKTAGKISNFPYIPVGSIQCLFKKELKIFQSYKIKSKVLAWDEKWLFVLSKFVIPDKKSDNGERLCAVAITKYVFKKNGRITIKPTELIKECNLYNDEIEKINKVNYELISHMSDSTDLELIASKFGGILN